MVNTKIEFKFSSWIYEVGPLTSYISQVRKIKPSNVKQLAQGHQAS